MYTPDGMLAKGYFGNVTEILNKTNLVQSSFGSVYGDSFGAIFVAVCLMFFAFSTILSWNFFGKINMLYLFGKKHPKIAASIYTIISLIFIMTGTLVSSDFVWELTDMFNNLMVIPNVIALFALTPLVLTSIPNHIKK
jgi:AGCS family alanine or glycine:cation symporter